MRPSRNSTIAADTTSVSTPLSRPRIRIFPIASRRSSPRSRRSVYVALNISNVCAVSARNLRIPSWPTKAPSVCERSGSNTQSSCVSASAACASRRLMASTPRRNASMCGWTVTQDILAGGSVGSWTGRTRMVAGGGGPRCARLSCWRRWSRRSPWWPATPGRQSILAGAGAVTAAAASSLIRPLPFGAPVRVAAAWVAREPEATVWRVVRGLAFVAAGVVVLVDGSAALTLLLSVLGIYLIYEGVSMILRLVYREEEHG